MFVTEFGMVMLVRSEQPENAHWPMLVTEYVVPLYVTVSGITTLSVYALWIELERQVTVAFVPEK